MSATRSREVEAAFDSVAATYADHYSRRGDQADSAFIAARARELYAPIAPGTFVDLGCGPGTMVPWLMLPNDQYLGVDMSKRMVNEARARFGDLGYRFVHGDEHTGLPRGETAFVLGAFGPLQYTDELPHFAAGIRFALRRGGRFLLMGRPGDIPTRILGSDGLTTPYSAAQVRSAFHWAWNLRVYTFRVLVPSWLPLRLQWPLLNREREFQLWLDEKSRIEQHNRGPWFVVEGQRGP